MLASSQYVAFRVCHVQHVDHGKTTLVDGLLRQSGSQIQNAERYLFQSARDVPRLMDSNTLEKERGITILSKVTSLLYKDHKINIVDTPGHADFGGEVERILNMVDGVVLVVDATEGPMAQTKFVLSKALAIGLSPIVVFNKVDRATSRIEQVDSELFDLFASLNANDLQMEYPMIYASAKLGWASLDCSVREGNMTPLLDAILKHVPPPPMLVNEDLKKPFSMLVTQVESNPYLGKCFLGRIQTGTVKLGDKIKVLNADGSIKEESKVLKLFNKRGLDQIYLEEASAGDIVTVAGIQNAHVNSTICDLAVTEPIPSIPIDPPTIAIYISVNDSPQAGEEGKNLTSSNIKERLFKEADVNVALNVSISEENVFEVKGRGELQLGVLLETMRREGFELSVSPPRVVFQSDASGLKEPIEEVTIDLDTKYSGIVIEKMTMRKGEFKEMVEYGDKSRLFFDIPTRGLLGYMGEFKNDTHGTGVLNHIFSRYDQHKGKIERSRKGALISSASGVTTVHALQGLEPRGILFVGPNVKVYPGMIIGEHSRETDLDVNPVRAKALSNMRAAGKEDNVRLIPCKAMTLEDTLAYVQDDEIIEITPKSVKLRKRELDADKRASALRKEKNFMKNNKK